MWKGNKMNNEFDLDLKVGTVGSENTTKGGTIAVCMITTEIVASVVTGCTPNCLTSKARGCQDVSKNGKCSQNTCTCGCGA